MIDEPTLSIIERLINGAVVTVPVLLAACWVLWKRLVQITDEFKILHRETIEALTALKQAIERNSR